MKKIEATIKPDELNPVIEAMATVGNFPIVVTEAGFLWHSASSHNPPPIITPATPLTPRIKMEVFVDDHEAGRLAAVIARVVAGEGDERTRVFIFDVEESLRYRPSQ